MKHSQLLVDSLLTPYILDEIPGVIKTKVGYAGGIPNNPSYIAVATGVTGHAETVHVEFDPKIISFKELLEYFWRLHDPTQLNRQGSDVGSQYRSVIFYYSEPHHEIAEESKTAFDESKVFKRKAVTQIVPANVFFPADKSHQKYCSSTGKSSCHFLRPQ